jgi:uncharacterized protein
MAPLIRGLLHVYIGRVYQMKQKQYQGTFLSLLFIVLIYLFTRNYYSLFSWFVLGLLLLVAFLREENRLFAWVMISFFGGNFVLFYIDKFIEGFQLMPYYRVILSQLMLSIPALSMVYVIRQFNKRVSFFFYMPELTESFANKKILYIFLCMIIGSFLLICFTISFRIYLPLILFVFIHVLLQEIIWRGILLTQLIKITNEKLAILISGIAFAQNTTIFGYSLGVFLLYLTLGFLLAFLTTKYKSILPSIFAHILVLLFIFLNGWLRLPI